MANLYPALFSPIRTGNVDIKHRIAMMPMGVFSPRLMGPNGAYTKDVSPKFFPGNGTVGRQAGTIFPKTVSNDSKYHFRRIYLSGGLHYDFESRMIECGSKSSAVSENSGEKAIPVHPRKRALIPPAL